MKKTINIAQINMNKITAKINLIVENKAKIQ